MKKILSFLLILSVMFIIPKVYAEENLMLMSVNVMAGVNAPIESIVTNPELFATEEAKGISYPGTGNIVEFNNVSNPCVQSGRTDVIINITGTNKISILQSTSDNQLYTITGTGSLEIKSAIAYNSATTENKNYSNEELLEYAKKHIQTDLEIYINNDGNLIIKSKEPIFNLSNNSIELSATEDISDYTLKANTILNNLEKNKIEKIESFNFGKLLNIYDITLENTSGNKLTRGNFTIKLPLTEKLKEYNTLIVGYIDEQGNVLETFDTVLKDNYVEFTTTHLSNYAILGKNINKSSTNFTNINNTSNPKTGDFEIINAIIVFIISTAILVIITKKISFKLRQNNI